MEKTTCIWILASVLLLSACHSKKQEVNTTKEPATEAQLYFGQNPPGLTPALFAPEVVSVTGRYEYAVSFSPDRKEIYFSGEGADGIQSVYCSKLSGATWTAPEKANFTKGKKKNEFEAFVSNKGDKIYFAAYDSIFADEKI